MNSISGFIITCLLLSLGYGIGLLYFLNDFTEDHCEMTYMFEYPQFVRISNKIDKQYPKYGLYAYSEGRFTAKARSMVFDGIPVLFIPGNAGSHKQVRSLSSVALRKALSSRTPFHFDYFTVDLNDEFSGLYGPLLYDQLKYVNSTLFRILKLYKRENRPQSIAVIGHSMGGVIVRNLLYQIPDPNLISVLITLSAPLRRAPIAFDYHMDKFYENSVLQFPKSMNTTIVSISGGYNDFLVSPYLSEINENNSLYAVTTNIPRCWIEATHIQIVWCKQLVLAISRALFDSVDPQTKQISLDPTYRNIVFKHHIVHHSGINVRNYNSYFEIAKVDYRGQWIESILRQYSAQLFDGLKEPHWYMVKLINLPEHEMLSVLAINLEVMDWVFACNAYFPRGASRVCNEAVHLTHLSQIAPSAKYKRRYFEINMHELKKNNSELTHIVFRALPTDEPVVFHVDVYSSLERKITVDLPKWWTLQKSIILEKTVEKAVHYELMLPQLRHIIQFYLLFVEPVTCVKQYNHASASLIAPWSHQNHHSYFTNLERKPLNVRLYSSKPLFDNESSAFIKLTLDPSCTYQISIKPSIVGMLQQIARFYTPLLLTNIAVVVLMTLKFQLKSLKSGHCSIFFVAIKEGAKPYYVLTIAKVLSKVFSGATLTNFLPKPDVLYLVEDGTDFFLLSILMYMCSVGFAWLLAVVFSISLITLESTVHKMTLTLLARTVSFNMSWSNYLMSALQKVPFIAAGILIFICLSTCGGLALCLGVIFYFLKLTQMSQDYIEEVAWCVIKNFANKCKEVLHKKKPESKHKLREKDATELIFNDGGNTGVNETITNKDGEMYDAVKDQTVKFDEKQKEKELLKRNVVNDIEDEDNNDDLVEEIESEASGEVKKKNEQHKVKNKSEHAENVEQSTEPSKKLCDDQKEKQNKDNEQNSPKKKTGLSAYNSIFFHLTLFFIWCIITVINVPAVLTWAHNFKFSKNLTPDDSFIPGFALSLCAFPLWQFEFPKIGRKWIDTLEVFVMTVAVLSLIYATISVYRLNYLLTLTIVIITLHQLFAPKMTDFIEEADGNSDNESRTKYESIKAKLD